MITKELFSNAYMSGLSSTLRLLLSKGLMPNEAEELAQAAWVRGWEARHQLKNDDRVISWVNSIAINTMCNEKRRTRRQEDLDENHVEASAPSPVAAKVDAGKLLNMCSPLDRSLMAHRFAGGFEMDEIAKIHGLTGVATRVRIHRAKTMLRRALLADQQTHAVASM